VVPDEAPDPRDVRLFGTPAEMPLPRRTPHRVQKPGRSCPLG
jgi:hypothetical protein